WLVSAGAGQFGSKLPERVQGFGPFSAVMDCLRRHLERHRVGDRPVSVPGSLRSCQRAGCGSVEAHQREVPKLLVADGKPWGRSLHWWVVRHDRPVAIPPFRIEHNTGEYDATS